MTAEKYWARRRKQRPEILYLSASKFQGKAVFQHGTLTMNAGEAERCFKAMTKTNGWATGWVGVSGTNSNAVEKCAQTIRAAGVPRVSSFPERPPTPSLR